MLDSSGAAQGVGELDLVDLQIAADAGKDQRPVRALERRGLAGLTLGHADEQGTREYNLAHGARRASAVQDFLIAQGVAPNRLRTVSYGKERPLAVCSDETCYSQNRRAVTVLSAGGV